jgi:type IV pilus assembly protein PilB
MIKGRKRLGDLLVEAGLISNEQLDKALSVQKKTGERLGKALINLGYITEESMIEVLEFQLGVPHIDLNHLTVPREIAASIPGSLAERYSVIPIKKEGKKLTLAMVDPTNFFAIDDVRLASGFEVEPVIAAEREILRAIQQSYGVSEMVEKAVSKLKQEDHGPNTEVQTAEDAPVISIVNSLISQAIKERASDIHIEPRDKDVRVRFRVDGVLREVATFPSYTHAAIISRVKIISEMDIAEKRLPQDGRLKVREAGREVDIRVSTLPTILGEKVVLRILDKKAVILDIHGLGFSADNLKRYKQLYSQSYGMILVTGPTGSGKTTTLYSTLTEINAPAKNIITVEDPVEYRLDGINQVQVNHKAGLTFASGLRSILRQDPNIVMVGEIRDMETADIAIRAALTGHLVLSTLHTNDAPGAVTRLIDMDIEPFLVASSVLGVVAQRLVRVICPECKQTYIPGPEASERSFLGIGPQENITLYHGTGCPHCNHTGYRGRLAIHEVMTVSSRVREAVNKRASSDEIGRIAAEEGMVTMRCDGIQKALGGVTTIEEVMRVAYSGL